MLKKNTGHSELEQFINSDKYSGKVKLMHWISIVICTFLYSTLTIEIVHLTNGFSGVIAQIQVMLLVLIALNPIKRSNLAAILLCLISTLSAICNAMVEKNMEVLPVIGVYITSIVIIMIISNYGKNLNNQMQKIIQYSQIVKKNEEMLHRIAYYDALTELPNRKMILDLMERLTDPAALKKKCFVFVYLDLDNFKKINDSAGHSIGDTILKEVALRFKEQCNTEDILGRVGGDEFAILIRRNMDRDELKDYLENYGRILENPVVVERKEFFISVSSGITLYPDDGHTSDELFKNAEIALYKAKNSKKSEFTFFTKEMQAEVLKKIQIENGLQSSIRNNELYMMFQPQYICGTNKLRGYEALVRWRFPEMGLVSPAQFIPIAEETGIIINMGKWILESVLRKFKEIQKELHNSPLVSINISVVQMIEPSFIAMIKNILKDTGYDGRQLELEITESVFITYPEHIIEVIKQLKELGIRIAIDDFGTGYASLNYLQILPIDVLKIDKTFIDKINSQRTINQMVGNIITLSHQLGIEVVAEGVERKEQLDYLIEHQCDYIQGYLLSKPIDENELTALSKAG